MDSKLMIYLADVLLASTREELFARVERAGRAIGFEYALVGIRVDLPNRTVLQDIPSGYPVQYQEEYARRGFIARDPTVIAALQRPGLLEWHEGMYDDSNRDVMEISRSHGLGEGLSFAVHIAPNVRGMISLARDKPLENNLEREVVRASAMVLANTAISAMHRTVVPNMANSAYKLSDIEKACLYWAAQGKTIDEISMCLRDEVTISPATVKFHLRNVQDKMGVASREQSVFMGSSIGLFFNRGPLDIDNLRNVFGPPSVAHMRK